MLDTEAFREFKTGLTFLRDNYANKALPHMRRAVDLDKNNPYYMSYLVRIGPRAPNLSRPARALQRRIPERQLASCNFTTRGVGSLAYDLSVRLRRLGLRLGMRAT
jgi:hypothetical protein